ncbi:MAG: excinuclease ABC subunit UvrC [Candidatus Bipolaricaulota bacterium]|nr:excinuclease ABC subunit UvrC [Candidatus Bipolaricaulota bacterium]MCS7274604.1 excinuclease ABC subunit UvrC [Candidatus Bipolaricaulota bacterium]MDW8110965.1 excinuclease ABC subunit UvrC [Candidatus Bipolaricaulota bacterium]
MHEKLALLPAAPGVYLFKDAHGKVLYVGKASLLRERLRSYFQTSSDPKTQRLMQEAVDFDYIITPDEREALLLEETLIKKHKPKFNIRLKDDKQYPYIKLTGDLFPRVELVRRREHDGARYFGPYRSGQSAREMIKLLQKLFRLRTCTLKIERPPVRRRPCLDHYIGLCDAPCVAAIPVEDYAKLVENATLFLRGRQNELLRQLRAQMESASERLEFERAAHLRDQIQAIERLHAEQQALSPSPVERDLIACAIDEEARTAAVQVFFVREGRLEGREGFWLDVPPGSSSSEVLTAFLKEYYQKSAVPKEIVLAAPLEDDEALANWLAERRGGPVKLRVPQRGALKRLIESVAHNAALALRTPSVNNDERERTALEELQSVLKLSAAPQRIEAFDISNLHGRQAVGSMVVFWKGKPLKSAYRRFRIQTVDQIDDFAMIAEVLRRRLVRGLSGDERFLPMPDLVLIDGGKGQLSAARAVMRELKLEQIATVALAKEFEHLFVEGRSSPIVLSRESPALQLLQRVRDEAHRFALSYHRLLRQRAFLDSAFRSPQRRRQMRLRR